MRNVENGIEFDYKGHVIKVIARQSGDDVVVECFDNDKLFRLSACGTNHYGKPPTEYLEGEVIEMFVNTHLAKIDKEGDGSEFDPSEHTERDFSAEILVKALQYNPRVVDGKLLLS